MPFLHFLQFQLRWLMLRKRWLLPLPVILFIAYRSGNAVHALGQSTFSPGQPNAWDLLFMALGNRFNVYFAVGLLYLYLVCDLLPEPNLGQMVLFRLRSRGLWWLGKLVTLLVATLVYLLGVTALLAAYASLSLPWEAGYSGAAQFMPETVNLPMEFFRKVQPGPPISHLLTTLLLLALGLFCIGVVMMIVTQLTRRYFLGLLAGCVLLFGALVSTYLSGPPPWAVYLMGYHLTYTGMVMVRTFPLFYSILYWLTGIGLAAAAGLAISRRQDYLAIREQEE